MGKGYSYDAIVGKHIAPIERVDPGFSRIISAQPDPGAARYVLGVALEAISRAGGDVVKGMRDVIAALDGKRTTLKGVLKQVGDAAREQVGRTDLRASRSSPAPAATAAQMERDARTMSPADFAKKYPRFVEGYGAHGQRDHLHASYGVPRDVRRASNLSRWRAREDLQPT